MRLGHKIRKIRELRNLSQSYVAHRLQISQSAYSKIENGDDISFNKFVQLSRVLRVEMAEILNFPQVDLGHMIYAVAEDEAHYGIKLPY
jgi:transcriptional regulator with XRE-family HTH domain